MARININYTTVNDLPQFSGQTYSDAFHAIEGHNIIVNKEL